MMDIRVPPSLVAGLLVANNAGKLGGAKLRNLSSFLVHLFGRDGDTDRVYLSVVHDRCLLCEETIRESPAYLTYRVCPFCRFHYTLTAEKFCRFLDRQREDRSPSG